MVRITPTYANTRIYSIGNPVRRSLSLSLSRIIRKFYKTLSFTHRRDRSQELLNCSCRRLTTSLYSFDRLDVAYYRISYCTGLSFYFGLANDIKMIVSHSNSPKSIVNSSSKNPRRFHFMLLYTVGS